MSDDAVSHRATSATGFDSEEMGMTAERQRVIQASLFKMLGQADVVQDKSDQQQQRKQSAQAASRQPPSPEGADRRKQPPPGVEVGIPVSVTSPTSQQRSSRSTRGENG